MRLYMLALGTLSPTKAGYGNAVCSCDGIAEGRMGKRVSVPPAHRKRCVGKTDEMKNPNQFVGVDGEVLMELLALLS